MKKKQKSDETEWDDIGSNPFKFKSNRVGKSNIKKKSVNVKYNHHHNSSNYFKNNVIELSINEHVVPETIKNNINELKNDDNLKHENINNKKEYYLNINETNAINSKDNENNDKNHNPDKSNNYDTFIVKEDDENIKNETFIINKYDEKRIINEKKKSANIIKNIDTAVVKQAVHNDIRKTNKNVSHDSTEKKATVEIKKAYQPVIYTL